MTQQHFKQYHMFNEFKQAPPLRQASPTKGFRWCADCNGSGQLFDPPRICTSCRGFGQTPVTSPAAGR